MDLSDLPPELVEAIAEYLNVEDLCACNRVNTRWKNVFDINRVWRRFCSFHPNYFDNQVNNTTCLLLSEGCKSKEQVFKELFVRSNQLTGNFRTLQVDCGHLYCDSALDFVDNVGNHWLFVSCMSGLEFQSEHYIYVWNMNDAPSLHTCTETPLGKIMRILLSEMKINKERLFFLHENKVLIYKFSYPLYELKFVQKIDLTLLAEPFANESILNSAMDTKIVVVGSLIVGFLRPMFLTYQTSRNFLVYVWNEDGILIFKEKEHRDNHELQDPPMFKNYPLLNAKTNDSDKVIVTTFLNCVPVYFTVRIFDISLLQFSDFFVQKLNKHLFSQDICGNVVSVLYTTKGTNVVGIQCYTIEEREKIFKIQLNSKKRDSLFHALIPGSDYGELIVLTDQVFHVFSLSNKSEIALFEVSGKQLKVTILNNMLMLLSYSSGKTIYHDVWNFKSGFKLYNLDLLSSLGLEQHYYTYSFMKNYIFPPKIIAYRDPMTLYPRDTKNNKIVVFSFW